MTPEQEPIAINECEDNILADLRRPTKQLIEDMNDVAMDYVHKGNQETGAYIKEKRDLIDQTVQYGREGNLFGVVAVNFKDEKEICKLIVKGLLEDIRVAVLTQLASMHAFSPAGTFDSDCFTAFTFIYA